MQDDRMPPDLEPVHRRLLADGDRWEAEQVPSSNQLAEFLRRSVTRVDTSGALSDAAVAGAYSPRPVRRSRVLSRALPAIAALLLISLGAALFAVMAHTRQQPIASNYPKSSCAPKQISVHQLQGVQLSGIAMVSPDEGWAAGTNFHVEYSKNAVNIYSSGPSLFHYSHCEWQPVATKPANIGFRSIAMLSAHDGWALGNSSEGTSIILHYDGSQWQRMPLPLPLVAGGSINSLEMLSDQEGWLTVSNVSGQFDFSTLYHGVNGVWKSVSLGYVLPERVVPFAPGEAWIVGIQGELLLYRDGTIVSFDQLPADIGANISMLTSQDGWLLETFPNGADLGSRSCMILNQGICNQSGDPTSRMLWHFDGLRWSDESTLISDPRIQTAMYAQIFSAREGWAFLVTGDALWLHNGQWRSVPWPQHGQFNDIIAMAQVSPVEYWAIASYAGGPPGQYDALLHFVDGSWWVYS
jgi:hypothetical protein